MDWIPLLYKKVENTVIPTGCPTMRGTATGNTRLRTEGRADQFTGNTKQAGDKVKDAFKH